MQTVYVVPCQRHQSPYQRYFYNESEDGRQVLDVIPHPNDQHNGHGHHIDAQFPFLSHPTDKAGRQQYSGIYRYASHDRYRYSLQLACIGVIHYTMRYGKSQRLRKSHQAHYESHCPRNQNNQCVIHVQCFLSLSTHFS